MWNRITACAVLAVCLALKADAFATMGHSLSSFSHASVGQRTLSLRRTFQAREVIPSAPFACLLNPSLEMVRNGVEQGSEIMGESCDLCFALISSISIVQVLNSRPSNGGHVKMVMSVEVIVGSQGILLAEEIFAQVREIRIACLLKTKESLTHCHPREQHKGLDYNVCLRCESRER